MSAPRETAQGPPSFAVRWRRWLWIAAATLVVFTVGRTLWRDAPRLARRAAARRPNPRTQDVNPELRALAQAVDAYRRDHDGDPASWSELLATPLLGTVPEDPWGRPYRYSPPAGARGFLVFSLGSDDLPGGNGEAADLDHRRGRQGR